MNFFAAILILFRNFYYDRLIGILFLVFWAADFNWNFRLQISDFKFQTS